MDEDIKVRSLPKRLQIGGTKRFTGNLTDPFQTWILKPAYKANIGPAIHTKSRSLPGGFSLFPVFRERTQKRTGVEKSPDPALLLDFSWDWVEYSYSPLNDISVSAVIWVPDTRVICGSLLLTNTAANTREITLDLECQISRGEKGAKLGISTFKGRTILSGNCGSQTVVFFLSADKRIASPSSSCLTAKLELAPGKNQELHWVFISGNSLDSSLSYLEAVIELDWAGEIARRKISGKSLLRLRTGNPERDFILALTQKQALLILQQLIHQEKGSHSQAIHLSPLQAWQLYLSLAPLSTEDLDGLLALTFPKTNLADKEKHLTGREILQLPFAAELLWQVHQSGFPADLWGKYLMQSKNQLEEWFSPDRDHDGDGIPEMMDLHANGLTHEKADIDSLLSPGLPLEHPGLAALLQNEICRLEDLQKTGKGESGDRYWADRNRTLTHYLQESWSADQYRYSTRDSITHQSRMGYTLSKHVKPGWNTLRIDLEMPSRLMVRIKYLPDGQIPAKIRITLHGSDWRGRYRVEEISALRISWGNQGGAVLTDSVYTHLAFCSVEGLDQSARILLQVPETDRQDISQLLPLWSPSIKPNDLDRFIKQAFGNPANLLGKFGLSSFPYPEQSMVALLWNIIVAQGLLMNAKRKEAGRLLSLWFDAFLINLDKTGNFYPAWDAQTGIGQGKGNWIESLLPVKLLLDLGGFSLTGSGFLNFDPQKRMLKEICIIYQDRQIHLLHDILNINQPGGKQETLSAEKKQIIQLWKSPSENFST